MKALILRFEKRVENIVKDLLGGIDYSELEFDISHWESFGDDLDGSEFDFNIMEEIPSEIIKRKVFVENNRINPEFMELYIRRTGSTSKQIYYYKDFLDSEYLISIINCDYRNIEIFSKDEMLLQKIKDNFLKLNLDNKHIKEIEDIGPMAVLQAWEFGKGIEW